jgi:MoaA/NifB/PqqE/SkfB family radical SAM enzyme
MHIETTTRCTLACPACPRTYFSDKFNRPFPKQDLDVDQLRRFLDCESGKTVDKFLLCGNHGDPIYYPDLFNLVDTFRDSKTYKISTCGSHQTKKFWHNLGDRLTANDTVYFSIDGLEHNNHLYRRNSNWESIMNGLDIMLSKSARVVWKTLIFSYNEHEIAKIEEFARSRGCIFVVEPSSRFVDQSLVPTEKNIDTSRLYNADDISEISPQCLKEEYISADGYYWPCCLITSYYTLHQTPLWKNRQQWAINGQTLDNARIHLHNWYNSILDNPKDALSECKMNCKPGQKFAWPNA